jgi:hypothetical protein
MKNMQIRIIIALLLLCSLTGAAQEGYLPYGTMRVNDVLIADQTEVLVAEWLGYIISSCDSNAIRFLRVERKLSDWDREYLRNFRYPDSLLPAEKMMNTLDWYQLLDTTGGYQTWKAHGSNSHQTLTVPAKFLSSKEKRKELNHLLNLPVTGITFAQAQSFCRWRTYIDSLRADTLYALHYTFSLPTIAEFNQINSEIDSTIRKTRNRGIIIWSNIGPTGFNYRNAAMELVSATEKQNDLQSAWEYDHDIFGLYGVQGNAAEMTSREGAACGGSYFHYAIESYRYQIQVYEHPERWLGFRCVAKLQ